MKKLFIVLVILFTTISISFADPGPNMKEGKWEITTTTEMQGMPMQMPAVTQVQCLTKEDLVPQNSQQAGGNCNITDITVKGDSVSWTMRCSGQGGEETKGSGEITYSGDSFKGTMKVIMVQANMQMISTMRGTRIGKCE